MKNSYKDKIAITIGDITGIGPEVTVKALNKLDIPAEDVVIIGNKKCLNSVGLNSKYEVIDVEFLGGLEYGKISSEVGEHSFQCLKTACGINPKSIVTAPVSKEGFHLAGHNFNGQTEVLEHFLAHDGQRAEMLFVAKDFRVLLLTRHCALKDVKITKELLIEKVSRLNNFVKTRLNITNPSFALCALNPHSGEGGIIGKEEINIIKPAVEKIRKLGINITEPLPADTLFISAGQNYIKGEKIPYDCYVAIYHDQGLIPIKTVASDKTVNMTIGLDIIRTSPCHGTAFDIAGKNIADESSMIEAINVAKTIG